MKAVLFKSLIFILLFVLTSTPLIPAMQVLRVNTVLAQNESCSASAPNTSSSLSKLNPRVGGVALNQAAKFLADMSEVTGAYYDQNLDRIVFVGKKNALAPKLDKDDLAVAIKAIMFNGEIPWVSLEGTNPDPNYVDAVYSPGIENTKFGDVLLKADWKMKLYDVGTDVNGNQVVSNVPGYKPTAERYYTHPNFNPVNDWDNITRKWITPQLITLKKDDTASAFIFETVKMQVQVEAEGNNDPLWDQVNQEQADHFTQNYDLYSQEIPEWAETKRLGQIAAVVKWINDSGIATDFYWARDYEPKRVETVKAVKKQKSKEYIFEYEEGEFIITSARWIEGGADLFTDNTYNPDNSGSSSAIKNASQAIPTTKEDIHWTFTKDSQQYEAVAVAADAFRSVGSYNTSSTDMVFPTAGDLTLSFQRIYSSFSGGQYGVGRGWSIHPASLFDNKPTYPAIVLSCGSGAYIKHLSFVTQEGGFESFTINDCNIGYVADDAVYHSKVNRNSDGTYVVTTKNQTQYIFRTDLKLSKIKDKNGNSINYKYDSSDKLTSISDTKNHAITLSYNAQNWISEATDWSGRKVKYTYDDQGNLLTVTDPNSNITSYTYDSNFKLISIKDRNGVTQISNTYTDEAKLASQKNAVNNTVNYSYDKVNRVVTATNNQSPARTNVTKYDAKARVLEQTDPLLFKLTYTYGVEFAPLTIKDKNGNTITNTYDANGNLTTVTYPDTKKVTYQYDAKNRLTRVIDERYGTPGKDITNTYDAVGNLTQINHAGQITKFSYDGTGEVLTLTDALNHVTTWTRDTLGNGLTEKDAVNNTASFEYDAIGRLKKKTDADLKITTLTYDNNSNVLTQNDGVGTTTNVYDKENRLIKVMLPDNTVSEFVYNPLGSLTSTKDQALNTSSYGYDIYQNLISQTDALAKITLNNYDALNRQTQSSTPMGKLYKYEYDKNGNITKRTDANNNATAYLYDAFNRLTKITYPDTKTVTFAYDNRGNRTQMVDSIGTSSYVYDNFDRLTKATNAYGKIIEYTYDNKNNLASIKYPDSGSVIYTYDNNDRLLTVKDLDLKTTTYTYNKNGTIATRLLPNGIKTTYTYDAASRVNSITHANSSSIILAKFVYTRNNLGNITSIAESGSFISSTPQITSFIYDALGRITKATYPGNKIFEYTYDKMGNRLTQKVDSVTTTTYAYDNDYKLIKKNNLTAYTYDNNGNQTKKPSGNFNPDPTFTYDFENRLVTYVTSAGNPYDFKYDGLGNRLRKNMPTAVTRYIYDNSGPLSRLMATSGDQNFATTFWIYGLGLIKDGDGRYHLEDASGNMRFTTSSTGSKSTSANYDPFGNIRTSSGILPDFRFNQQQFDEGSGLYYLRARYYDPETGRFISRDPVKGHLAIPQTHNPYTYAINDPINLSDPSGEQVWVEFLKACVGKGASLLSKSTPAVQRGTQNPKVQEAITKGQEMHKLQQYPTGYQKEIVLESGKRVDAMSNTLKHIIELKPNNPAAIQKGEKQLEGYLDELNATKGGGWTGEIWTY